MMLAAPFGATAAPGDFIGGKLSTCFWNYGAIAGTSDAYNVAYPDGGAIYWAAGFRRVSGATLKLRGTYPHARYTSLISYNQLGRAQDGLADYQLDPDPGSTNPFRAGADRTARQRSYTVNVLDRRNVGADGKPLYNNTNPKTDELPRNDLYAVPNVPFRETINGQTYENWILVLRIYVPDKGLDLDGGVPLPEPELTLADGTVLSGQALCDAVDSESKDRIKHGAGPRLPDPATLVIDQRTYQALRHPERLSAPCNVLATGCPTNYTLPPALVQVPRPVDAITFPATDPPTWRGAYDRRYQLQLYTGNDAPGANNVNPPKNEGGFFPNMHNNYVRVALNRNHGKVVVMRARLPKSPKTWNGQATLPTDTFQTRYTSLCLNESMRSTRVMDCVFDEEMPTDQRGFFTVVISRAEDRPSNASQGCGRAWIEWSPRGDGEDEPLRDPDFGLLGMRNMLPDPSFAEAIQNTQTPGDERQVMGDYLPTVTYMSPADVENAGCAFGGLEVPINADGSGVYKLGRTIPVKFRLDDATGNPAVDAVAKLDLAPVTNGVPGAYVPARSPSQGGNTFASLGNGVYHYNLSTAPLSAAAWSLRVTFMDGTEHFMQLTLR
jgi:hypothetical protein